jgi:hypothetical protein
MILKILKTKNAGLVTEYNIYVDENLLVTFSLEIE